MLGITACCNHHWLCCIHRIKRYQVG